MAELYSRTKARERQLVRQGYNVESMWKCDWDKKLKSDPALRRKLTDGIGVPRLDPRESLYGNIRLMMMMMMMMIIQ